VEWETNLLEEILEKYIRTRMDYRGRIYIPKKTRRKLGIREGDVLYVTLEENQLKVVTSSSLRKELRSRSQDNVT